MQKIFNKILFSFCAFAASVGAVSVLAYFATKPFADPSLFHLVLFFLLGLVGVFFLFFFVIIPFLSWKSAQYTFEQRYPPFKKMIWLILIGHSIFIGILVAVMAPSGILKETAQSSKEVGSLFVNYFKLWLVFLPLTVFAGNGLLRIMNKTAEDEKRFNSIDKNFNVSEDVERNNFLPEDWRK